MQRDTRIRRVERQTVPCAFHRYKSSVYTGYRKEYYFFVDLVVIMKVVTTPSSELPHALQKL